MRAHEAAQRREGVRECRARCALGPALGALLARRARGKRGAEQIRRARGGRAAREEGLSPEFMSFSHLIRCVLMFVLMFDSRN